MQRARFSAFVTTVIVAALLSPPSYAALSVSVQADPEQGLEGCAVQEATPVMGLRSHAEGTGLVSCQGTIPSDVTLTVCLRKLSTEAELLPGLPPVPGFANLACDTTSEATDTVTAACGPIAGAETAASALSPTRTVWETYASARGNGGFIEDTKQGLLPC
jgi:hypothetical protein